MRLRDHLPGRVQHLRIELIEALAQNLQRFVRLFANEPRGARHRASHAHAFLMAVTAGFGPRINQPVGEWCEVGGIARRRRQHDGTALHDRLRGERHRGGIAIDRLVLECGQHRGRVHRRDAHVLLEIEPAAACHQPLPGMHDAPHALDRDGLAFHRPGAFGEWHLVGDPGGIRDILAQHQLDQWPVDHIDDREQPLALRRGAQEHRTRTHGKVRAAGDHRVDRSDADDIANADAQAFLLEEARILRNERRTEGECRGRQRQHDVDILSFVFSLALRGTKPNHNAECQRNLPKAFVHGASSTYHLVKSLTASSLCNNHGEVPRVHMDISVPREGSNTATWSKRLIAALRARSDQFFVLLALLAIWQTLSVAFGSYWIGSPWGVLTRFAAGVASGELLRHASYTLSEAVAGFLIGALPAIALPFWLRRLPVLSAILDPFMVGGYGAPKLALAPLFILWFGVGIASKIALVAIT